MMLLLFYLRAELNPGAVKTFDVVIPEHGIPELRHRYRPVLQSPDQAFPTLLWQGLGERRRAVGAEAQEGSELGMQAVEDDGTVSRPLLPGGESGEIGGMVMGGGGGGLVDQPHPPL